jgi:formimidoylglutamate deiminase
MKWWKVDNLYSDYQWRGSAYIQTDGQGKISKIEKTAPDREFETLKGALIPGFLNAHSHAFQYSMLGLFENLPQGKNDDDFWSWRRGMYQLALKISPDQMEAVATMLYSEMARMGITHVGEFHYIHHDPAGRSYNNLGEMGHRLFWAAKKVGIKITLLPVFYQRGDFDKAYLSEQRRFISPRLEDYFKLLESSKINDPLFTLGVCVHSLRAVEGPELLLCFKHSEAQMPAHIHVAEQEKEVALCEQFYGKRPVQWLLDNLPLSNRYNLVHATHMSGVEVQALATPQANVVVCPSTEANLGDGLFSLREYHKHLGCFCIGTDGHFNLNPLEELRLLDYGQRLGLRIRNPICLGGGQDSAEILFRKSQESGYQALGQEKASLRVGDDFDGVLIDLDHPILAGKDLPFYLSSLIYSGDSRIFKGTIVQGKWVIKDGRHDEYKKIFECFRSTQRELLGQK